MSARRSNRRTTGSARRLPKARLEAFSDGVFAIVITLLVLELEVPPPSADIAHALAEDWPAYLGYLISFSFIGGAWIAHTNTTRFIRAVDAGWMRLNLLLLLFVSFLPFTTSLMATHLNETDARTVTVLFGTNLTLAALMVSVLMRYSANAGLPADDVAEAELEEFAGERRVALVLQAAATVLAIVLPVVSMLVFLAISLLLLLEPLVRMRGREVPVAPADGGL